MISWITKLFGTSKNVDTVIETAADGIYNGIDKLVYTDEEKAEALAKGRELFMDFAKIAYDQNSIRSIARRWLAFMVVGPTMLAFTLSIGAWLYDPKYAQFLLEMVINMGPWAAGVLAFYFGPHLISSFGGKK